jgi:hypothetical protein
VRANVWLGLLLIVFCVLGIVFGIVRVGPGRSAAEIALAVVAAAAGAGAFVLVLRAGRRGAPPWTRWLVVAGLLGAFFVDRLSEPLQLALLALGAGYVGAFVATIVVRVVRAPG